jgi:chromosome segregation ATPase
VSPALLTFVGIVFVALCGLAGTIGAQRVIARANRDTAADQLAAQRKADADRHELEERKVNREDFDAITRELRASLAEMDRKLTLAEQARNTAESRAATAEQRADRLERRVTQLEEVLRENHMTIPPQPASA